MSFCAERSGVALYVILRGAKLSRRIQNLYGPCDFAQGDGSFLSFMSFCAERSGVAESRIFMDPATSRRVTALFYGFPLLLRE